MTADEILDKVEGHLMAQGEAALDDDGQCSYRTPDGLKCAVGCLLSEGLLNNLEGNGELCRSVDSLEAVVGEEFVQEVLDLNPHMPLLVKLQRLHDSSDPWTWKQQINEIRRNL